jgi:hypothetical protein
MSLKYHRSVILAGKLIFRRERWYQRLLHNENAFAVSASSSKASRDRPAGSADVADTSVDR